MMFPRPPAIDPVAFGLSAPTVALYNELQFIATGRFALYVYETEMLRPRHTLPLHPPPAKPPAFAIGWTAEFHPHRLIRPVTHAETLAPVIERTAPARYEWATVIDPREVDAAILTMLRQARDLFGLIALRHATLGAAV